MIIGVVLVAMVAFVLGNLSAGGSATTAKAKATALPAGNSFQLGSAPPGQGPIRAGVTAKDVAKDGSAVGTTTTFNSKTDRKIVAVLTLANLPAGTQISYARFVDGTFVDTRTSTLAAASQRFYFDFNALPGKNFNPGGYTLKLYINQKAAWELLYRIT
jgi:hypothetical protein